MQDWNDGATGGTPVVSHVRTTEDVLAPDREPSMPSAAKSSPLQIQRRYDRKSFSSEHAG